MLCVQCDETERQQQQSLEIERYKRDWQHERDASDKLRQQLHQLQVDYLSTIINDQVFCVTSLQFVRQL